MEFLFDQAICLSFIKKQKHTLNLKDYIIHLGNNYFYDFILI